MPAPKRKPSPKRPPSRNRPRIENSEKRLHTASATLSNKQAPKLLGTAMPAENSVLISAVLAETVPVAQYANVVVGPIGIQWTLGAIDMEDLIDVEWGDVDEDGESTFSYEDLTPKQRAAYDRVKGAMRATIKVGAHSIAEERETIDISIRRHNERLAEEEAEEAKAEKAEKRQRRARRG
jgi:hypothetical protein